MTDTSTRTPTTADLAPSVAKVLAALHRLGEATAAATAAGAGLGYSTTTPKLRTLENVGLAEPTRGEDGRTLWRLTDAGRDAASQAAAPADGATDGAEPADQAPPAAPASEPDPDPRPPAVAPAQTDSDLVTVVPGEVFDDLVAELDPGAAEVVAALDHTTADSRPGDQVTHHTEQQPDLGPEGNRADLPGGASADDADGSPNDEVAPATGLSGGHPPTGAAHPPAPTDTDDQVASAAPPADTIPDTGTPAMHDTAEDSAAAAEPNRRAAGSLRGAILDILEANPDQRYKVSELCKLIDRANEGTGARKASAGAVNNAATKLVAAGSAVLAVEKPATFALARSGRLTGSPHPVR